MTEGETPLSHEEAVRMGRTADSLGSADDDTAGTPEHNMRADLLEARGAQEQGLDTAPDSAGEAQRLRDEAEGASSFTRRVKEARAEELEAATTEAGESDDNIWQKEKAETIGRAVDGQYDKTVYGTWEDRERYGPPIRELPEAIEDRERLESGLEELYEMNPEHFAIMPTKEFIEAYRKYQLLKFRITSAERDLVKAQDELQEFMQNNGLSSNAEPASPAT